MPTLMTYFVMMTDCAKKVKYNLFQLGELSLETPLDPQTVEVKTKHKEGLSCSLHLME